MRKDDEQGWSDDVDLDRVRATSCGITGGWMVVALIAALIAIVPPAVCAAAVALADARQGVVKVEHRLAQAIPRFVDRGHPC